MFGNKHVSYKKHILVVSMMLCLTFSGILYAEGVTIQRIYVADFEAHPTSLGGKIGVYGAAAPMDWQSPGDNFSWFYGPTIQPVAAGYDMANVYRGVQSFRLVNMRSAPNWASMGINLGPIIDPSVSPMVVGSIDVSQYDCLEFWIKGAGASNLTILFRDIHAPDYTPQLELTVGVSPGEWTYHAIPVSSITGGGVDVTQLTHIGFDVGAFWGNSLGDTVYIDEVAFSREIGGE